MDGRTRTGTGLAGLAAGVLLLAALAGGGIAVAGHNGPGQPAATQAALQVSSEVTYGDALSFGASVSAGDVAPEGTVSIHQSRDAQQGCPDTPAQEPWTDSTLAETELDADDEGTFEVELEPARLELDDERWPELDPGNYYVTQPESVGTYGFRADFDGRPGHFQNDTSDCAEVEVVRAETTLTATLSEEEEEVEPGESVDLDFTVSSEHGVTGNLTEGTATVDVVATEGEGELTCAPVEQAVTAEQTTGTGFTFATVEEDATVVCTADEPGTYDLTVSFENTDGNYLDPADVVLSLTVVEEEEEEEEEDEELDECRAAPAHAADILREDRGVHPSEPEFSAVIRAVAHEMGVSPHPGTGEEREFGEDPCAYDRDDVADWIDVNWDEITEDAERGRPDDAGPPDGDGGPSGAGGPGGDGPPGQSRAP